MDACKVPHAIVTDVGEAIADRLKFARTVLVRQRVIEEDEPSTSKARNDCVDLLEATLDLCDALRPTLGAITATGRDGRALQEQVEI